MAKGQEPVKFQDYESDSTEEEEEEAEEEEQEEGSEEGASSGSDSGPEQNPVAKKPKALPQVVPQKMKEPSETETETDSTSGSESDSDAPDPNAHGPVGGGKPKASIDSTPKASALHTGTASSVSRPAEEEKDTEPKEVNKSKKKPKDSVPNAVTSVKASGLKRPAPAEEKDIETKDVKKSKKPPEHELETPAAKKSNDDSKKQLFQRIWSEDDEIVILKGMIDYVERNKSDPVTDLNAFHNFIKDNLHVDVTRIQLQDKIRRLKKKYENNKGKEKEGKDRISSKPHEQKAYELSKQIWGCLNGKESGPKVNESIVRRQLDRVWPLSTMKSSDVSMDERVSKIGAELFEGKDAVEGASEWKMLAVQEIEIHLKMLEIKRAKAKLVLDSLTSSHE